MNEQEKAQYDKQLAELGYRSKVLAGQPEMASLREIKAKLDALATQLGEMQGARKVAVNEGTDGFKPLSVSDIVARLDALAESQGKLQATGDGLADEMHKLAECIASLPYRKVPNAHRRRSKPLCGRCGKAFRACKCRVFQARKP